MDLFPEKSFIVVTRFLMGKVGEMGFSGGFMTPEKVFHQILETRGSHRAVAG